MKRFLLLFIAVLISLNFMTCEKIKSKEEKKPQKTIVVLFDLSESTRNLKKVYSDSFKTILSSIGHGDVIVAAKITNSSISEPEIPIKKEFPEFVPTDKMGNRTDNPILVEKSLKEANKKLADEKARLEKISNDILLVKEDIYRKILNTDIVSSLHVAEKIFKNYKRNHTILVIFSDMIEDSKEYNFEKENLTDKRIEDIIKKEKLRNRIPDLQGVKIYVVAAGTKESNKFFAIQNFWLRYFKECGADLSKERYGSALLNFNE
ncbi:MAG: hypothetical protein AB1480_15525 [Nitrospirota bacterium]